MADHCYDPDRDERIVLLAVRRATGLKRSAADHPDACQVARLALHTGAGGWDPARVPWHLYGLIIAYRAVRQWDRCRRRRGFTNTMDDTRAIRNTRTKDRRQPAPVLCAADEADEDALARTDDPAGPAEANEAAELVRSVLGRQWPDVRGVLESVMAGQSMNRYGRSVGKSHAWVSSVLKRERPALREALAAAV